MRNGKYVRKITITSDGGSEYHNLCSCLYRPKTTMFGTNTAIATPFELIMRWRTIKRLQTRGKHLHLAAVFGRRLTQAICTLHKLTRCSKSALLH